MAFEFPTFGDPVDPDYVRFKSGVENWILGHSDIAELRWRPSGEANFFKYSPKLFLFNDWGSAPYQKPAWTTDLMTGRLKLEGFNPLPDLFEKLRSQYDSVKRLYPTAMWSPRDGSWREVIARSKSQQDVDRLRAEVKRINDMYDRGEIDDEVRDAAILKLIDEMI